MREISPAKSHSAEEWLASRPPETRAAVEAIRQAKREGIRPHPSATLIDRSSIMAPDSRKKLLDAIAALVDENCSGRSDMCLQFADLLAKALSHLKFPARPVPGWEICFGAMGDEIFRWEHAWVRIGDEVVDGNVDCLDENPRVPKSVSLAPYWGPVREIPGNRRLRADQAAVLAPDEDVERIWWPELREWLDREMRVDSSNSST